MARLVPALAAPGQNGSGTTIAADYFDRAIAGLARPASDAAGGYLTGAFNARRRAAASAAPYNLAADVPTAFGLGIASPAVSAGDAALGQDAIDFGGTSTGLSLPNVSVTASYTAVFGFVPASSGANGYLLEAFPVAGGAIAQTMALTADGVLLWAEFGPNSAVVAPRSSLHETTANFLVISAAASDRSIHVWLNSADPVMTTGLLPNPWPSLGAASRWGVGGQVTSFNGESNCRISHFAMCNVALHKAADGPRRIEQLVAGAARSLGIELA